MGEDSLTRWREVGNLRYVGMWEVTGDLGFTGSSPSTSAASGRKMMALELSFGFVFASWKINRLGKWEGRPPGSAVDIFCKLGERITSGVWWGPCLSLPGVTGREYSGWDYWVLAQVGFGDSGWIEGARKMATGDPGAWGWATDRNWEFVATRGDGRLKWEILNAHAFPLSEHRGGLSWEYFQVRYFFFYEKKS